MANEVQLKTNVGDQVITRVNNLCKTGFVIPAGYSVENAIKASMLVLQDLKDKNGKYALQTCSQASIQRALFRMVTKGLDASKNQGYFIARGTSLCFDESYFGRVKQVRRIYPNWHPQPVVIREGDKFEVGIDITSGKKYVKTHETSLENMDHDFIGGYLYLPTGECYIMSKAMILKAWSKSSSREKITHKDFSEKMVGKTLVNSGCNMIINSEPELNQHAVSDDYVDAEEVNDEEYPDFEEVEEQPVETVVAAPAEEKAPVEKVDDDF